MDVNQVRFGECSIGNQPQPRSKGKEESKEDLNQLSVQNQNASVNPEEVLSALNALGVQNFAQIQAGKNEEVNPADFLSEERISDIEAMMDDFENGVNQIADVVEAEFPNAFAPDEKMALAAKIYAQE